MNLVSIVIPSYNSAAYIKEAVDSALAQTYPNYEVIVIDDGSTDSTRMILEPYIRDRKIVYIHQTNKGLAGARNTGIRAAKGEYVAFLDSDDIFMPEKIAKQVVALESHSDFGVCYCDLTHFLDPVPGSKKTAREYYHHVYQYFSGDILPTLLHKQFLNPLTIVARKEVFEKYGYFDETFRRSEDWDLWLRWAHGGVRFYYLDEQLAYYRVQNGENLSSLESEPTMKEKNYELFERFGKSLSEDEWKIYKYQKILDKLTLKVVFAYLMVGKKAEALDKAKMLSIPLRVMIATIPKKLWVWILGRWRTAKHRLLLKRI